MSDSFLEDDDELEFERALAAGYLKTTAGQLAIAYASVGIGCFISIGGIFAMIGVAGALSVLHRLLTMPKNLRPLADTISQVVLGIGAGLIVLLIGVPMVLVTAFTLLGALLALL